MAQEWRPEAPVKYAPVFRLPPQLGACATWLLGWPGYLWPWNAVYLAVAVCSHTWTTPTLADTATFQLKWLAHLFLRNLALIWLFAGGWHALLYWPFRVQGTARKYDLRWQARDSPKFLFGDQVKDNVFWSCASGVPVWTAYEALFLWLWAWQTAGATAVYVDWWACPLYSVAWLLLIPIWREFHFYWAHRLLHVKVLYKRVHYLHHKNVNPGPWSGLAMHPVEHLLYFSVLLVHLAVPSHPLHLIFNAQHTALTPAGGHHGFDGPLLEGKLPTGSYFHYLHHRYFECNCARAALLCPAPTVPRGGRVAARRGRWRGDHPSRLAVRHVSRRQECAQEPSDERTLSADGERLLSAL